MIIKRWHKIIAIFIALNMLFEVVYPTTSYALTGGPSQPEVQSFEPVGTTEMVDLFSGDFNYNIPLLDVGGYPINISYHSGIGMDQEASWVGLGWNINPGVINRGMRGIPDDFNGEAITNEAYIKPNTTYGASISASSQTLGIDGTKLKKILTKAGNPSLAMNFGIFYNNYKGIGYEYGITPTYSIAGTSSTKLTAGIGLQANSQSGVSITPKVNFSQQFSGIRDYGSNEIGLSVSSSYNSRQGLKSLNMSRSLSRNDKNRLGMSGTRGNKVSVSGFNGGSSITYSASTYVPNISMAMKSFGLTLNGTIGMEIFGIHGNYTFTGYFSTQSLRDKRSDKRAYGYLYIDAKENDDVLMDFNRERDGSFSKNTSFLPLPNLTYDQFSVSGQGIGGSYRLHRSDYGIVFDDKSVTTSGSGSLGAEFGAGNLLHNGVNAGVTFHRSESGRWVNNNFYDDGLDFAWRGDITDPLYEPAYFKNEGEKTPADKVFYDLIGFDKPVRVAINLKGTAFADRRLVTHTGPTEIFRTSNTLDIEDEPKDNVRQQRDKRNQVISYLAAEEAQYVALERTINSYGINQDFDANGQLIPEEKISRVDDEIRMPHHISEITAINPGGMRYVYGIPAYNNTQVEKTFTIEGTPNCATGQVMYSSDDAKANNGNGEDEYFSSTTTPGYAHSYLLTAILSPDYVDLTGDGISDDDFGTATKINYSRVNDSYKWRVPYKTDMANYNEGFRSDPYDDKASFVYGTKELWYIHSIESKNQIAIFEISDNRDDGHGVDGVDGGYSFSDKSYKLVAIHLYSKQDLIKNGGNAEPIKSVHFEYEETAANQLCPGVDNNNIANGGKLTLTRIYFTYGSSAKGKLTPYKFTYNVRDGGGTALNNYGYNLKGYDRWGNYAPNAAGGSCTDIGTPTSSELPYTTQDDANADLYASAWSLTKIQLPSGGVINIEYESDDYAYVQDKGAMRMFKIKGLNDNPSLTTNNKLFENGTGPGNVDKEFVYLLFDLESDITGANAVEELKRRYFRGMTELYFSVFADVNGKGDYEYIQAWADIDREASDAFGVIGSNVGWVKLKKVSMGDKDDRGKQVNPISKTIWNYARLNLPHIVYPYSAKGNTKKDILGLGSLSGEINRMVRGFYRSLRSQHFGEKIYLAKSIIRLYEPDKIKNGGGVRVKKITVSDEWETMGAANTGATSFEYGQEYDYTMTEIQENGEEWTISSGVASYEPQIGGNENPWRHPIVFENENKMAPDDRYMQEGPIGESFFPGASVGYRKVTVSNIAHEGVNRTATGYQVHEFYTTYDFPTIVNYTHLDKSHVKPEFFASLFSFRNEEYMTASQGYSIELNDMHGKPKAQWTYDQHNNRISGIQYFYKTDPLNPKKLYNKVQVVGADYKLEEAYVGMDIDFVADMREHKSVTTTAGAEGNMETFFFPFPPVVVNIPVILPSYSEELTQFNSAVLLKVINRYGILEKTVAYQEGSTITTHNLLYDNETGEVLLTQTQNEFADDIYNFTTPAHWVYEGMSGAYKTVGATFKNVTLASNGITLDNGLDEDDYLMPGDELYMKRDVQAFGGKSFAAPIGRVWVYDGDNNLNLIMENGENSESALPTGTGFTFSDAELKVIRPARRNMQTMPIASITTKTNPITFNGSDYVLSFTDVLNTEAIEYFDQWQTFCNILPLDDTCGYTLTQEAIDLSIFLDHLASNGILTTDSTISLDSVSFVTWYNASTIKNQIDTICEVISASVSPEQIDEYGLYYPTAGACPPLLRLDPGPIYNNQKYVVSSPYTNKKLTGYFGKGFLPSCCSFTLSALQDSVIDFDSIIGFDTMQFPLAEETILDGKFYIKAYLANGDSTMLSGYSSCFILGTGCPPVCRSGPFSPDVVNPYTVGLRGNWRQLRGHKYLGERTYSTAENVRTDGVYTTYQDYWDTYNATTGLRSHSSDPKWVWTSEVSKYSPFGAELENRDALNRYSAAVYGYNNTLPVAVASNSKYRQIGFDGFEDYDYLYTPANCEQFHWNFKVNFPSTAELDDEFKHSGLYSLKLDANTTHEVTRTIFYCENDTNTRDTTEDYKLKGCDCIGAFSPDSGRYIISGWIKDSVGHFDTTYDQPIVEVIIDDGSLVTTLQFQSQGRIIDGWQRLEAEFTVPANAVSVVVKLKASPTTTSYFDDFRIHPFNGNMKTYVYHPINLRLMAELDENNYATFYEYDNEGALIRIKKETKNGIVTIQESRNSFIKKPE